MSGFVDCLIRVTAPWCISTRCNDFGSFSPAKVGTDPKPSKNALLMNRPTSFPLNGFMDIQRSIFSQAKLIQTDYEKDLAHKMAGCGLWRG
jgi:hypothetical protein